MANLKRIDRIQNWQRDFQMRTRIVALRLWLRGQGANYHFGTNRIQLLAAPSRKPNRNNNSVILSLCSASSLSFLQYTFPLSSLPILFYDGRNSCRNAPRGRRGDR